MRIHTDNDLSLSLAARTAGVSLAYVKQHGSKSRARAYEVALNGSSPYQCAHRTAESGDKAATWDEWGIFLDALFDQDPHLIAGPYKGRNDFLDQTLAAVEANERYEQAVGRKRAGHTGPWLFA